MGVLGSSFGVGLALKRWLATEGVVMAEPDYVSRSHDPWRTLQRQWRRDRDAPDSKSATAAGASKP
jgi:hypothetical protein